MTCVCNAYIHHELYIVILHFYKDTMFVRPGVTEGRFMTAKLTLLLLFHKDIQHISFLPFQLFPPFLPITQQ